jgi:hypothetical protein
MTGGSGTRLDFDDLSMRLLQEFPELRPRYEEELNWWGSEKPGQHIVYGDIFTPFLVALLESGKDRHGIERAFALIEALLNSDDVRVQEVAVVTILEYLQGKQDLLKLAEPFLGPLASTAVCDLEQFWEGRRRSSQ